MNAAARRATRKPSRRWPVLVELVVVVALLCVVQVVNARVIDSDELTRGVESSLVYLLARGASYLSGKP